jgi:hypothetical protein
MKEGEILMGRFFSKDFIFQVSGAKGIVLAHNLEGHTINTIDLSTSQSWIKHKDFKKVSPNDLPLYLDMKVLNPEFTKLIKERGQKHA